MTDTLQEHVFITDGDQYLNAAGNVVTIRYDADCESPRASSDHSSRFYTWLRRYVSPDDAPTVEALVEEYLGDESATLQDLIRHMNDELRYVALPVSIYEHGNVTYRVGTPDQFPDSYFDAGYAGIIFEPVETTDESERERVAKALAAEVETYSAWADGSCYGYVVEDESGHELDACWGYIGNDACSSGLAEDAGDLLQKL